MKICYAMTELISHSFVQIGYNKEKSSFSTNGKVMWLLLYKIGDEQTGSLGGLGKLGEVLPEELELSFNLEIGYPLKKCIQLCCRYVT